MSLVTRCPACTTTFKVVRDQLRISDGWVRCGRCSEVFDATLDLMDTESGEAVPPHSFISPKPPPLDDVRASVPPEPSSVHAGDGDRRPAPLANPFEVLQSDLRSFGQEEPVAPTAPALAASPTALPMSWPAPGLLELPTVAAAPAPAPVPAPAPAPAPLPPPAPLAAPQVSAERVALRPEGAVAPAPPVPAWRRIQVAPAPPPAIAQEPEGVMADEPWPMRRASAPQDAAPPPAPTSAIDAAVDAQLQKALRRARVQALREEQARQQPSDGDAETARSDTARAESASASVLRQASTDGAPATAAAVAKEAPSADTLLDSTLYAAEFLVSRPAALEPPVRRRHRAGLFGLLALLAGVLLAAQVLRHDRNALAASQPALRPAIDALCEFTACVVSAPRRIDAVRIDGSSFTPSRQGERYELMFTLRNSSPTSVAMPSIELSLLDGNERPVMRRVFHPADFGAPTQMGPRAEQVAQLHLSVQVPPDQRAPSVMGYSMLAFYP